MNIDHLVAEVDLLVFVDGQHDALLADFFDGARLGNIDFNA